MLLLLFFHQMFLIFIGSNAVSMETINPLHVKDVNRSIDLSTHLVKISNVIYIENIGKRAVNSFFFAVEPIFKSKVAFLGAHITDTFRVNLKISESNIGGHADKPVWKIQMKNILLPGCSEIVNVDVIVNDALSPYPKEITQNETQFVCYFGNHYFYTPYLTNKQTTTLNLGTRNIESYSNLHPFVKAGMNLTYGPYVQIKPFSENSLYVHFENNSPFLALSQLKRVIEVSHWGNIAVEETLEIRHIGAALKGGFSRYQYEIKKNGISSFQSFKTFLPASACDVYYRDEIGNISTSNMQVKDDSVEIELRPRFPLFGGWKTHYVLGYNVPSYEYLYHKNDFFKLKMRLVDHVINDMFVNEATIKIILPEGAHSINLFAPYPVRRLPSSKHFTYLDIIGRPVVSMAKSNVVENHIMDFELSYIFPRVLMLLEPLLIVFVLYLFFILIIVYVRLDFSISRDKVDELRQRASTTCEEILVHQDKLDTLYFKLDEHLDILKTHKDINAFHAAVKSIKAEYLVEINLVVELLSKLKSEGPEMFEKVSALEKINISTKELYNLKEALYLDSLNPNKINLNKFVLENKKKDKIFVQKINAIKKTLRKH